MSNIIRDAWGVQNVVHQVFPDASVKGKVKNLQFYLSCKLDQNLPKVKIFHQLDARGFKSTLEETNEKLKIARVLISNSDFRNNMESNYCVSLLENWKSYQRTNLNFDTQADHFQLLKDFLLENSEETRIKMLNIGDAPEQFKGSFEKEDVEFFSTFFFDQEDRKQENRGKCFTHFKDQYPILLVKEVCVKLNQRYRQSVFCDNSEYKAVLQELTARVVGQNATAERIASLLCAQTNSNKNYKFLFVGPSGVGKTEMAKAISGRKNNRFVFLAMNQYESSFTASNLFGSPSGYVGSTDRPHLAQELSGYARRISESRNEICYEVENVVILFDEFEKAHEKVKQSLLTLIDEGYCIVQYTIRSNDRNIKEKYTFKKSFIIATSNLYQQDILKWLELKMPFRDIEAEFKKKNMQSSASNSFSQELLGRFTGIIPFGPIARGDDFQKLIKIKLAAAIGTLRVELGCKAIRIREESEILKILEIHLYGEGTDLRRINNYFDDVLTSTLYTKVKNEAHFNICDENAVIIIAPIDENRIGVAGAVELLEEEEIIVDFIPIEMYS